MTLQMVDAVRVRPDRIREFQQHIGELAARAADRNEAFGWTAHRVLFGDTATMYFVTNAGSFEQIQALGTIEELWQRVFDGAPGLERFFEATRCLEGAQHGIAIDRPELSYVTRDLSTEAFPYASLIVARARSGSADALEELIRKVAEAVPKVDDPARILTYQTLVGPAGSYYTVRPLHSLAELDAQQPTPALLDRAFGAAEGGLLWRTGLQAIEDARREIVALVPELSYSPRS